MRVVCLPRELREASTQAARAGLRVGLVPTMGFLHAGHLALVKEARARADVVVMSVFVNPLQFGPAEDFAAYPRDLERDRGLAEASGVDVLWVPTVEAMYPVGPAVTVSPGPVGSILEGAVRPGHFAGVLTVVLKLFAAAAPAVAVFGRKDAQQAALVRFMIRDFNLPVELIVAPTVRDADGLALSSRNVHLDVAGRRRALALPRALAGGVEVFRSGERRAGSIVAAAEAVLGREAGLTSDYVACVNPDTFLPTDAATDTTTLAVAARVGATRLIDNVVLGAGLDADVRIGD